MFVAWSHKGNTARAQRFCFARYGYGKFAFFDNDEFLIVVFMRRMRSLMGHNGGSVDLEVAKITRASFEQYPLFRNLLFSNGCVGPCVRSGFDSLGYQLMRGQAKNEYEGGTEKHSDKDCRML